MFTKYIKLIFNKKNIFSFIKLNIFSSMLEIILFFILPVLIKRYYIIGAYEGIVINSMFLFLFESSSILTSNCVLNVFFKEEKKVSSESFLLLKALLFALLKTIFFIIFLFCFKKLIKMNMYFSLLLCFTYMFLFLVTFWMPCLLVKDSFFSSFRKSIHLYFSYPFFTVFVFLHLTTLFLISVILLSVYPGVSKIMYNMHTALHMME